MFNIDNRSNLFVKDNRVIVDCPFGRLIHYHQFPTRSRAVAFCNKLTAMVATGNLALQAEFWKLQRFNHVVSKPASAAQVRYMAKLMDIPKSNKARRADLSLLSSEQANTEIKRLLNQ